MSKAFLICTDLDRTLLPNGKHPESPSARAAFSRLVSRPEITLAYVSGRHRKLVEDAIHEYDLPLPDWVIGDVGTTIYNVSHTDWQQCSKWEKNISANWRGLTAQDLRPLFSDLLSLQLQEESKQNRYKLSYYLQLPADISALQNEMSFRLKSANMKASLTYSTDETASVGLLDVLPAIATKLHAIEFLMRHQGFDYTNTVFAGDSGNDLPVLSSGIYSILVANAADEVIEQAKTLALQKGNIASLYLAQGGFLGMNGNYCAGILEGVAHYRPDTLFWMEKILSEH